MALVGLLSNQKSLLSYYLSVERLSDWCKSSYLEFNVKKPKELLFNNNCDLDFDQVISEARGSKVTENSSAKPEAPKRLKMREHSDRDCKCKVRSPRVRSY